MRASDERFRRAFDEHFDAINRYCLRRLSPDDANDAAAQVFVVAWRKVEAMPAGQGTLPWLYGIARYEVSTMRRSTRRRRALRRKLDGQRQPTTPGPGSVIVRRAEHEAVIKALDSLSETDREVILLSSYEDLSTAEIAVVLDLSHEATKKRLSRALKRLRKQAGFPRTASEVHQSVRSKKGGDG